MEQAAEIENLHQQLMQTNTVRETAAQALRSENEQLRGRVEALEAQLRASQGAVLDMQNRVAASEMALQEAEEAARAAVDECTSLQQAVSVLAEHDAASRKALANRAHTMRDALVASRGRVRQAAEQSRRHRIEVSSLVSLQRQAAQADREALAAQLHASLAAGNRLERAAAQLQVERLELELAAYKEPWEYMFGRKSPSRDGELSNRLGLKRGSMNVAVPY